MEQTNIVRQLRKERGWTQAELAKRSGLCIPVICKMERNAQDISLASMKKVADALEEPLRVVFML